MSNNLEDDGWIRPLGIFESFLEVFHQQGFMISSYCLTLNSKNPLEESHVKKSLLHLLRKAPNLSVCIRSKKENELWFHKMDAENIDFQILENVDDVHKEFEDLAKHHYNSFDGPLWCARLIPQPLDSSCAMPEIKLLYPHQYILLLGFHHSITDGTSNIKICDTFLTLLNNVISGESINEQENIGEHISTKKTEDLILATVLELMSNPEELEIYKKKMQGCIEDILFLKAFPPTGEPKQTISLSYSLSKEETSSFIKRCKKEGVTVHAGFCSVINAAIADLLTNAGLKKETFAIRAFHTINTRRYWEGDTSQALGAHLGICTISTEINSHLDVEDFWKNAKEYHSNFTSYLINKAPLKEAAAMHMALKPDQLESGKTPGMPPSYYGTTNMGNVTSTFSGEGDHVQVTDFKRTTSTSDNICSHVMQTFRGRFIYCIDYDREFMSKETAQLYVDTIFKVLRKVANILEENKNIMR